jgi:hypothetical protein
MAAFGQATSGQFAGKCGVAVMAGVSMAVGHSDGERSLVEV